MLRGFAEILPGGDIMVSEEASTYRPEMAWLAAELNALHPQEARWRVLDTCARTDWQERVYRFFELFDLANVPAAPALMDAILSGSLHVTPPFKPALEEKLWFALFWLKPLEDFWLNQINGCVCPIGRGIRHLFMERCYYTSFVGFHYPTRTRIIRLKCHHCYRTL